tara:strand:+ start:5639 stop:5866 length:228 start_codon:yes stop_codon:yes gene_type:complete
MNKLRWVSIKNDLPIIEDIFRDLVPVYSKQSIVTYIMTKYRVRADYKELKINIEQKTPISLITEHLLLFLNAQFS